MPFRSSALQSRAAPFVFACAFACLRLSGPAAAAEPLGGTIKFIVGAAPGGPVETYARIVAEPMSRILGANIVVETHPGANGVVAAQFTHDQAADGRTVWVATQSMIEINPYVYSDLRWTPGDFTPLIKGVEAPLVLAVHPTVPAKTLPELIDWMKANRGKLAIASYSPGTPGHFLGVQMNQRFDVDLAQATYKGSAPQVTDALGGYSKVGFFQTAPTLPHIQAGALRAIAVTGATRYGPLPDTPTFAELGYPDFLATVWYGLLVSAKTPPDIAARLIDAAKSAHEDPKAGAALKPLGLDVVAVTGPALAASIKAGADHWRRMVETTGFKASE